MSEGVTCMHGRPPGACEPCAEPSPASLEVLRYQLETAKSELKKLRDGIYFDFELEDYEAEVKRCAERLARAESERMVVVVEGVECE